MLLVDIRLQGKSNAAPSAWKSNPLGSSGYAGQPTWNHQLIPFPDGNLAKSITYLTSHQKANYMQKG